MLLIACLAACLWLLGAHAVAAQGGVVSDARADQTLVIDLGPRPRGALEPDDGRAPSAPRLPTASYRTTGPRLIDRLTLWPWPPAQGQTLVVSIVSRQPVTLAVTFLGRPAPLRATDGTGWALAAIPPLQKPGYLPLTIRAGSQQLILSVLVRAGKFETINIPQSTAGPILSQAAKVNAETARMTKLFAGVSAGPWSPRTVFSLPLHGRFPTTSAFGSRRTYGNDPTLSAHAGQDFSAIAGTPVYAPAEATVVLAEPLFVRGNAVVLDHGNGVFTGYWHLSELAVKAGQQVQTGALLGKVGSTGLSTGAHLHWEMRVGGMAVDPVQWVGR